MAENSFFIFIPSSLGHIHYEGLLQGRPVIVLRQINIVACMHDLAVWLPNNKHIRIWPTHSTMEPRPLLLVRLLVSIAFCCNECVYDMRCDVVDR